MSSFTDTRNLGISIKAFSLLTSLALHAAVLATAALLIGESGSGPAESSSTLHVNVVRSEPADESPKDNPAPETSEQTAEQPEYVKSKPKHIVKQTQPEPPPLKIEVAPIKDRTQQQPKTTSVKSKSPGNKPTPEKKGAKTTDKKPMQLAKVGNYSRQSRDYQSKLLQLIERNKYYPLKARRSGMEGTSTVAFTVRGNGNIRGISLARSSGTQLLDQAAIQTIKRIGHAPPLPGGRNSWRFTVPILYNLK